MEKVNKLLENHDVLNLLSFIDGKRNISTISKETNITYKTTFYKIKELEQLGVIEFKNRIPTITEKYGTMVLMKVIDRIESEKTLKKAMDDKDKRKRILSSLNLLLVKRGVSDGDFRSCLTDNYKDSSVEITQASVCLQTLGLIRYRPELTKLGKRFLEEQTKTVNKK